MRISHNARFSEVALKGRRNIVHYYEWSASSHNAMNTILFQYSPWIHTHATKYFFLKVFCLLSNFHRNVISISLQSDPLDVALILLSAVILQAKLFWNEENCRSYIGLENRSRETSRTIVRFILTPSLIHISFYNFTFL